MKNFIEDLATQPEMRLLTGDELLERLQSPKYRAVTDSGEIWGNADRQSSGIQYFSLKEARPKAQTSEASALSGVKGVIPNYVAKSY